MQLADSNQRETGFSLNQQELLSLKHQNEQHVILFGQISKHLQIFLKFLRDSIAKSEDPVVIEQNQRQVKAIERLHQELKRQLRKTNDAMLSDSFDQGAGERSSIESGRSIELKIKNAASSCVQSKNKSVTTDCDEKVVGRKRLHK